MNVYIESVRLVGCQGYRDVTLDFSPGLNILKADDNSVGKSILFKMLREAATPGYWGREGRKQLIRWGCPCAEMYFRFSDQTGCIFRLYPTYRQYIMQDFANGFEEVSETPPKGFLERMCIIASDLYIANMLTTQGDLLFVESSGSTDRALLTLLTNHEGMENLIERTKAAIKVTESKRVQVDSVEGYLLAEFRQLSHVDTTSLEMKKEMLDLVIPALEMLEGFTDVAETILEVEALRAQCEEIQSLVIAAQAMQLFLVIAEKQGHLGDRKGLEYLSKSLEALSVLRSIPPIHRWDVDEIEFLRRVLEVVSDVNDEIADILKGLEDAKRLKGEYLDVKKVIDERAEKGYCPFHKSEVFYDAKGCIPCCDRFT